MKYCTIAFIFIIAIFNTQLTTAQEISASQLSKVDIDNLSDEQISGYWNKAKAEGYTLEQLEVIATSRGMSATQFSKLKQRIAALKYSSNTTTDVNETTETSKISDLVVFGLDGSMLDEVEKNPLFGYLIFN